jgi:hypothetical protein
LDLWSNRVSWKAASQKAEAALLPQLLVAGVALLVGEVDGVQRLEVVVEPGERAGAGGEPLGQLGLDRGLVLGRERALAHGDREVRCALEDGQVRGVAGRLLDDLHAAGTGADHGDALSGEGYAVLRPQPGVVADPAVGVQPRDRRDVGLGGEPEAGHEVGAAGGRAVGGQHDPLVGIGVELGGLDAGVEPDVAGDVELAVDVGEVLAHLAPGGVEVLVLPVLPEVPVGELVDRSLGIDAGARVAVPVPDAAECRTRFEDLH